MHLSHGSFLLFGAFEAFVDIILSKGMCPIQEVGKKMSDVIEKF